ncbi:hypothetical protein DXG01_012857 [Tephrocybe rancida]|nr:hypothetical protein DXG01_012857 [Tephrocybe rancida]
MSGYTLCDNRISVESALVTLQQSTILAFDSEGLKLGQVGGKLSFIVLRSIQPVFTPGSFLFDAIKLSEEDIRPIFDILESSSVQKVVFDGRMDSSCLYHDHGVHLQNIVDLQLADIKSRAMRGEGFKEQLQLDHSTWLERPATEANLAYAARDADLITMIFNKFIRVGYIYGGIVEDSLRYAMIWADAQPRRGDRARSNAFLQLDILDHADNPSESAKCTGCMRTLPKACFPSDRWNKPTWRKCHVCCVAL